ncbi:hypothetical protein HY312_00955 [Candidatus Saccharibacteria bacterium]|nr:hypothetical protein [Candidatus Saccharibacteria bacterium]
MGFLSDLGGFISQVQQVSDAADTVKQDLISGVKDVVMNVETQGKEVATELQASSDSLTQTAKSASDDIRNQL